MPRVTALTPAQWQDLARFRETWYAIGSACGPSDRPATTAAITEAYALLGLAAPTCIFVASPASALLTSATLGDQEIDYQHRQQLAHLSQFENALWYHLRGQLMDALVEQLKGVLWGQIGQCRDALWGQLKDQLWDERDQFRHQLWGQLSHLRHQLRRFWWGQHDAWWIAYYTWAEHLGIVYPPRAARVLAMWHTLATSCGWWLPLRTACLVADRPVTVSVDGQRRLHAEEGPAVHFSDGYGLWAWHGLRGYHAGRP